jgi:hypothetical protein
VPALTNEDIMRLVTTIQNLSKEKFAKVYRDTDWNEYRVKFFECGIHQVEADYHTDDKDDALDTARLVVFG